MILKFINFLANEKTKSLNVANKIIEATFKR